MSVQVVQTCALQLMTSPERGENLAGRARQLYIIGAILQVCERVCMCTCPNPMHVFS